uniref:Uncharacterized protein n=1 Tax=Leersia perrieri TaxID=77586 RepID=A0A0D9XUD0_9ORYZ
MLYVYEALVSSSVSMNITTGTPKEKTDNYVELYYLLQWANGFQKKRQIICPKSCYCGLLSRNIGG